MADYREISQQYAQGAVKAAMLLNGGAAVALLSQTGDLVKAELAGAVRIPMVCWALGTVFAALVWTMGFYSARYVDKHEREKVPAHLRTSDRFMHAGSIFMAASLVAFIVGCFTLAAGLGGS